MTSSSKTCAACLRPKTDHAEGCPIGTRKERDTFQRVIRQLAYKNGVYWCPQCPLSPKLRGRQVDVGFESEQAFIRHVQHHQETT